MADDLSVQELEQLFIASGARRTVFQVGCRLFNENNRSAEVVFVHRGEARVFQTGRNNTVRLAGIFGPGDWIGAAALACKTFDAFDNYVVATTETEASVMPVGQFLLALQDRPELAITLLKQAATRLMGAYDDAARLVFDDCNERLLKALIALSDSPAAVHHGQNVTLRITHQQLAQAVGAARETISLALTELRNHKLLETGRNRLIFNPEALRSCRPLRRAKTRDTVETAAVA